MSKDYNKLGWATFPCSGKIPATANGFKEADKTGEVFKKYPGNHNVGIATGHVSGIWVLDIDVKDGAKGAESLAALIKEHGPLPETVTAATWSGGAHYFFRMPAEPLGCRTNIRPGIDVRADGGYVVAPPSTINGKAYKWVKAPGDVEIAKAPAWLLAMIERPRPTLEASEAGDITAGGRNDEMARRAGAMRAAGLDASDIYAALAKINALRCKPPLPDHEIQQISRSISRYAPAVDDILTGAPHDQEGHFQVFNALYGKHVKYTREMGWVVYHDGFWDRDLAERYLSEWITEVLRRRRDAAGTLKSLKSKCEASRANLDAVRGICRDRLLGRMDDFNTEPHLLNCANGVLDLRTFKLTEHSPDHLFNYKLRTAFNPNANMDAWNEFVAECVGDKNDGEISAQELLKISAGYSITGDTSAETMFYVFGPPRSGKGTFMTAVQNVLGGLANTVNIGTLTQGSKSDGQNFELAGLAACRYVTVAETGRDTYLDAGRIKNLTGNDPIQCAFKFKDSFRYTPKFKIWISSNHEVNLDAGDDAVWDRLRAFHFMNSHKDNPDTSLKRKLTGRENAEAVLLWCAQGARMWYALQAKGRPMPRTEAMRQYLLERKDEADYVKQFLEDQQLLKAGFDATNYVPATEFYGRFKEFCCKNHIDKYLSLRNFISDLKRRGFIYTQKKILDKNLRVFLVREMDALDLSAKEEEVPF